MDNLQLRTNTYTDLGAAEHPDVNLLPLLSSTQLAQQVVLEVVCILFLSVSLLQTKRPAHQDLPVVGGKGSNRNGACLGGVVDQTDLELSCQLSSGVG